MNGQQFSSSSVSFTYRASVAVSSVWPSRGVSEGGTPVTVVGSGFSSSAEALGTLMCRLNATVVSAAYVSESTVICNTTASAGGYVSVDVSTNGHEYTSSGVYFEAVSVVVESVHPWCGPALGGTTVTISGAHVSIGDETMCSFTARGAGAQLVRSSAHGEGGVRCTSPEAQSTGWSSVELVSHGMVLHGGASFYVHSRLWVSEVVPGAGPVMGGTVVTLSGARIS